MIDSWIWKTKFSCFHVSNILCKTETAGKGFQKEIKILRGEGKIKLIFYLENAIPLIFLDTHVYLYTNESEMGSINID